MVLVLLRASLINLTPNSNDCQHDIGRIYAGNWKDGQEDGVGEVYWLKSSNVWQSDHYPGSAIKQRYEATGGNRGVPFHYKGRFSNGCMVDEKAVVTLKDGTSRMGPWKNNEPVGRWDEHTLIARPVQREVTEEALRASQEQRQMKPLQAKKRKQPLVSVDRSGKLKRDAEARERIRIAAVTPSKVRPKKHENQKKRQRAAVAPTASVHGTNLHPQQQAKGSAGPHDKAEETNRKSEATENKDTEPHNKARRTSQQASHEDADNRKRVASSSVSARGRTQGGNSRPSQRSSQNQAAPRQISSRTDVNRIYDSDTEAVKQEEDTSPLTETSASAAVPPTVTEKQRRIDQISEYITHQVIRNNPNPITIAEYAEKLYGLGFESVEMIRAYLKPRHIQSFDWLTFLHKEIFLERLESSS